MGEIRWNLINHIREQLEAGTYLTAGKLSIVCDKLLERLAEEDPDIEE